MPPTRRYVGVICGDCNWICVNRRGLVCWIVTQVQDVCLTWLVGRFVGQDPLVSSKESPDFKEIVDRMGRWPGYGGSAVAYGRMAGLWGSAKTYGKCVRRVAVWGNRETYGEMACVGGRRIAWGAAKTYGKCHGIWEPAPAHGEAARPYGEPKITSKPGTIGTVGGLRTLHDFNEFLVGGGGPAFATVKASHRACCECRGA